LLLQLYLQSPFLPPSKSRTASTRHKQKKVSDGLLFVLELWLKLFTIQEVP